MKTIYRFLYNWRELWLWVPLAMLSIWGFAQFGFFLTGRQPTENVDWIVGMAGNLMKCILLIVILSIGRESNGVWATKIELMSYPRFHRYQTIKECVSLIVFAYLLSH